MSYKLKPNQEPFQCCGGIFEGRKFLPDQIYTEIPPEEADKFEEVNPDNLVPGTLGPAPRAQATSRKAQDNNKPAPDAPREE